ncbi:MAG: hypothetical protein KAZ87_06840 [Spirochaetes bacterium]|nr:hypothetical protein [Spirochaetota bacterium]
MKKIFAVLLLFVSAIILWEDVSASSMRRRDDFMKPQAGIWFGPGMPLFELYDKVEPALGGGAFFRLNTPLTYFKIGGEVGYQKHKSQGVNAISLVPVYGNVLFLLPIKFPMNFQFKLGAGGVKVYIKPEEKEQFDPLLMAGLEVSFMAGRMVNFGLRFDCLVIYENRTSGAKHNGYFFNTGLTLYFNL